MTVVIVLGQPRGGTSAVAGALARLGLPYAMQPTSDPPTYEDELLRKVGPKERVAGLVERERLWGPDPWVHKDPVAIDDFDEWRPLIPPDLPCSWIVVFREPYAVALTEFEHIGLPIHEGLRQSLTRLRRLARTAWLEPGMAVSYEHLLRDPQRTSARLAEFVGVPDRPRAAEFLRPGYRPLPCG